jgi:hypothetical protein
MYTKRAQPVRDTVTGAARRPFQQRTFWSSGWSTVELVSIHYRWHCEAWGMWFHCMKSLLGH